MTHAYEIAVRNTVYPKTISNRLRFALHGPVSFMDRVMVVLDLLKGGVSNVSAS